MMDRKGIESILILKSEDLVSDSFYDTAALGRFHDLSWLVQPSALQCEPIDLSEMMVMFYVCSGC